MTQGHVVLIHGPSYILVKITSVAYFQALFSVEALLWECLTLLCDQILGGNCVTRFWVGIVYFSLTNCGYSG